MRYVFVRTIYLFFLPIVIPIIIFKKITKLEIFYLNSTRVGNLAIAPEMFFRDTKLYKGKKNIIFLFASPVANKFITDLYKVEFKKRKIKSFEDNLIIKIIFKTIYFWFKREFFTKIKVDRKKFYIFDKFDSFLSLSEDQINKGYEIANSLGLSRESKWICIHNRDNSYLKSLIPKKNWDYHNYRDFSVNDYKLAIKYLLKEGFYIVRIGKNSNHKLSYKNSRVIDLPFHHLRSDFLEAFLISQCEFYIGSSSGAVKIPRIFRKPIFLVNVCPLESVFVETWNYPCIFKKAFYTNKKRFLSANEMIKEDLSFIFHGETLISKKIKYISNTPNEILDFSKEILIYLYKTKSFLKTKSYKKYSNKFSQIVSKDKKIRTMNYRNLIGRKFLKSLNLNLS